MDHSHPSAPVSPIARVVANLRSFLSHPAARAVGLTFAADSLMFGTWVTQIPFVKTRLGLSEGELGLALFGMPIGLLLMNPLSPWILQRVGLVRTTVWSTVAMALSFALPIWMPTGWALFGTLVLLGVIVALMNVAMNTCATNIEEAEHRHIMSSCHGMWSFGGMLGSAVSAVLIQWGVSPFLHLSTQAVLVVLATLIWLRPALEQVPAGAVSGESGGSTFAFPSRDLLLMIFVGLCTSLCEGVAFDWSAVYLRDDLGAPEQVAALGFTGFSLAMMGMRFTGDVLIPRFGERALLYFTAFCSAVALILIVLSPVPLAGIGSFLVLGAGVALAAPILFNAAARVPGLAPGAGLATYATFSFVGFLAGPPVIGLLGEHYGLPVGFALVALLTILAALAVRGISLLR